MAHFLMAVFIAEAIYYQTATVQELVLLTSLADGCHIIEMLLTWRPSLMSHHISFMILRNIREAVANKMAKVSMSWRPR